MYRESVLVHLLTDVLKTMQINIAIQLSLTFLALVSNNVQCLEHLIFSLLSTNSKSMTSYMDLHFTMQQLEFWFLH